MKLDSKYFDSIRIGTKRRPDDEGPRTGPRCQAKGCDQPATHRAPKGRGRDGEYYRFCVEHVRAYNASYNYFDGMSDVEVADFQKDALTGHRPTWKLGVNSWAPGTSPGLDNSRADPSAAADGADPTMPGRAAAFFARRARHARAADTETRRHLRPLERKALATLGLPHGASREDIKARFKELVKVHHPDANGGDTRSEDKLREIIQAYNYLKQSGLA